MALIGCAGPPQPRSQPALLKVNPKEIVILAPQGVDPGKDTVGFNSLVERVTRSFAAPVEQQLLASGYRVDYVLDQKPGLQIGQKLALYAHQYSAARVAVATIESEIDNGDDQLQLRIQYTEGELTATAFTARTSLDKRYVLRGSRSGDNPHSITDLADDYVSFLAQSGRLFRSDP